MAGWNSHMKFSSLFVVNEHARLVLNQVKLIAIQVFSNK